jgi:hypothetical protein
MTSLDTFAFDFGHLTLLGANPSSATEWGTMLSLAIAMLHYSRPLYGEKAVRCLPKVGKDKNKSRGGRTSLPGPADGGVAHGLVRRVSPCFLAVAVAVDRCGKAPAPMRTRQFRVSLAGREVVGPVARLAGSTVYSHAPRSLLDRGALVQAGLMARLPTCRVPLRRQLCLHCTGPMPRDERLCRCRAGAATCMHEPHSFKIKIYCL